MRTRLRELLSDNIIEYGLTDEEYKCKVANINSFLCINREGLKKGEREKRLIMYQSLLKKETVYIEYPGKESTKEYARGRQKTLNPNDFRPELFSGDDAIKLAKLSFVDIALAIDEYATTVDVEDLYILAALLVRLAYMHGFVQKELLHPSKYITYDESNRKVVGSEVKEDRINRYYLSLGKELKELLADMKPIRLPSERHKTKIDVSIEGFLYYVDMIAQQEDCKYYYKDINEGKTTSDILKGRINSVLTVVNIIDRIQDDRPFGDIIGRMGLNPNAIKRDKIVKVTDGIIKVDLKCRGIESMEIS